MASSVAEPIVSLAPGETRALVLATAFSSTLDAGSADPLAVATKALEASMQSTAEQLVAEHVAGWARIWEEGSVEVEGDGSLAAAINGSLYNILSSVRADWPYGVSPGGLASGGCKSKRAHFTSFVCGAVAAR